MKKKIMPIICALGLMVAYPAIGSENNNDDLYKDVKKLKITRSYHKWFNENGLVDEEKYSEVERTFKDGRVLTETDKGIDGTIDSVLMKYTESNNMEGCQTIVVKEDYGNDGSIDCITTYEQMLGGSKKEIDLNADGKPDYVESEMLVSKGTITEIDADGDEKIDHRITKKYLDDNSIITEYDFFADSKIDYVATEKVLADGTKVTKIASYDNFAVERYDTITEKTLPDGTKLTELDLYDDGTVDYREREKITRFNSTSTRVHEVEENGDGLVTYQHTEEILEMDMP